MSEQPRARTDGLVSEQVEEDLVVYDAWSQSAHALSNAVSSVWRLCDGSRAPEEIAADLGLEPALVDQALAELSDCRLLDQTPVGDGTVMTRRLAAKRLAKVGGVAFAAPMIYSAAIGPAIAAASGAPNHTQIPANQCRTADNSSQAAGGTVGVASACASDRCYQNGTGTAGYCIDSSNTPGGFPSTCQGFALLCTGTGGCCATCSGSTCT